MSKYGSAPSFRRNHTNDKSFRIGMLIGFIVTIVFVGFYLNHWSTNSLRAGDQYNEVTPDDQRIQNTDDTANTNNVGDNDSDNTSGWVYSKDKFFAVKDLQLLGNNQYGFSFLNNTDQKLIGIKLAVKFYDADGNVIKEEKAIVGDLESGAYSYNNTYDLDEDCQDAASIDWDSVYYDQ
jgi:hypothetical protein